MIYKYKFITLNTQTKHINKKKKIFFVIIIIITITITLTTTLYKINECMNVCMYVTICCIKKSLKTKQIFIIILSIVH